MFSISEFVKNVARYFAYDLRAWKIAELSGVSRPTINQLFMKLRIRIAQVCNALSPLSGEVEVDEPYFGTRRVRGKNVNSDLITERKISLVEYLLY